MELAGAIISCIGSVIAAAISAYATVLVAKMNKDEIAKKGSQHVIQNNDRQSTEVSSQNQFDTETTASLISQSKSVVSESREIKKSIANNAPVKRQNTLLITSNLLILVMICTMSGLTLINLETPYLLIFAGISLIFGVTATFIKKKWVTNIALVSNSIIFVIQMAINLFYFTIVFLAIVL